MKNLYIKLKNKNFFEQLKVGQASVIIKYNFVIFRKGAEQWHY